MAKILIAVCIPFLLSSAAQAASPIGEVLCAPRAEMRQKLTQQFGAHQAGVGTRGPEAIMEVWSSARTGDWTLVMTYTDGKSCIVAMGENWEHIPDPA